MRACGVLALMLAACVALCAMAGRVGAEPYSLEGVLDQPHKITGEHYIL